MPVTYRIHPAIGIARVGDSPDEYFIGPEAPRVPPSLRKPDAHTSARGTYKDKQNRIKRQGARFRIYEYTYDAQHALQRVREITAAEAQIEWEVNLANRKGMAPNFLDKGRRNAGVPLRALIIDSKPQTIIGASQALKRLQGTFKGITVPLGDLLTDSAGRLIVLGGFGKSQSVPPGVGIHHFANNDGWCDDISDGPVRASVQLNGSTEILDADSAWVICAPPDFAPAVENVITLNDVVYNVQIKFHRELDLPDDMPLSFTQHIYPILMRTATYIWLSSLARRGHGPQTDDYFIAPENLKILSDNAMLPPSHHAESELMRHHHHDEEPTDPAHRRLHVFEHLRNPHGGGGDMPMLNSLEAQDPVALTDYQYKLMKRWAEGRFANDWTGILPQPQPLDELATADQPAALDRAALEACVGGGFFPGIEVGRVMRDKSTYDKKRPFRISTKLKPGFLTEKLAVPWQADFRDCGSGWWPAQRPNQVMRDGSTEPEQWIPAAWKRTDMVKKWSRLGFVVRKTSRGKERFVEDERFL